MSQQLNGQTGPTNQPQPGYQPGYAPQPGYQPGFAPQPGYQPGFAPQQGYVPYGTNPPPRNRHPWLIVSIVALAVAAGLMFWAILRTPAPSVTDTSAPVTSTSDTTTSPAADIATWFGPITLPVSERLDVSPVDLPGVAVFESDGGNGKHLIAIDLDTHEQLWQTTVQSLTTVIGDDTGLVAYSFDGATLLDPKTGQETGRVTLKMNGVLWAGQGVFVTNDDSLCVRSMAQPNQCLWQVPGEAPPLFNPPVGAGYVFGGGKWINTGSGVRDLMTGQPASFGADTGGDPFSQVVIYAGDSPDRVFRVVIPSDVTALSTFQPWDTTADTALSDAVPAKYVVASPNQPVWVAVGPGEFSGPTMGFATARQWQSGEQAWQVEAATSNSWVPLFVGDALVLTQPQQGMFIASALDPATGKVLWQDPENYSPSLIGSIGAVVLISSGWNQSVGYDMANGAKQAVMFADPSGDGGTRYAIVSAHVIAFGYTSGDVYILDY